MADKTSYHKIQLKLPNGKEETVVVDHPTYVTLVERELTTDNEDGDTEEGEVNVKIPGLVTDTDTVIQASQTNPVTNVWTHDQTMALIKAYKNHINSFNSPNMKKMDIWKKVATVMKACGHNVTYDTCDKKMRQLRYRYKAIEKQQHNHGRRRWEYFHLMEDIMARDTMYRSYSAPATASNAEPAPSSSSLKQSIAAATTSTSPEPASEGRPSNCSCGSAVPSFITECNFSTQEAVGPSKKKKRKQSSEPPDWFVHFMMEQRHQLNEIKELQRETIRVREEGNTLLRGFTDTILKINSSKH